MSADHKSMLLVVRDACFGALFCSRRTILNTIEAAPADEYGGLKIMSTGYVTILIDELIRAGYLEPHERHGAGYVGLTSKGQGVL